MWRDLAQFCTTGHDSQAVAGVIGRAPEVINLSSPIFRRVQLAVTFSVITGEVAVRGFAPPVVALAVTEYVLGGVPAFFSPLLPPQAPSHSVEQPRTAIMPKSRHLRGRAPAAKTIPNKPGTSS